RSSFILFSLFAILLFFFNAPPPSVIYTLSLHDALPIYSGPQRAVGNLTLSDVCGCCRSLQRSGIRRVWHVPLWGISCGGGARYSMQRRTTQLNCYPNTRRCAPSRLASRNVLTRLGNSSMNTVLPCQSGK